MARLAFTELERILQLVSKANSRGDAAAARDYGMRFYGALLRTAPSPRVRFADLNLCRLDLRDTSMPGVAFISCNMEQVILTNAYVPHANFSGSKLRDAYLYHSTFNYAEFSGCDLSGAELTGSALVGVKGLDSAKLNGAILDESQLMDVAISILGKNEANKVHQGGHAALKNILEAQGCSIQDLGDEVRSVVIAIDESGVSRETARTMLRKAMKSMERGEGPGIPQVMSIPERK